MLAQGEWRRDDGYIISTDQARLDLDTVCAFLRESSYWAQERPRDVMERSIANSLAFGVYRGEYAQQIGFARVVTDYATFGWLGDVFILAEFQGHGLGKWLIETVVTHPDIQGMRRLMLATRDAHGLYSQYGFTPLPKPDRFMVRNKE